MGAVPIQQLAREFYTSELIVPDISKDTIIPARDLAFVRDVNLFFLRRLSPAYHWAPFPVPDYDRAPSVHQLLLHFIEREYPTKTATPAFLSSLVSLITLTCPTIVKTTAQSTTISFTDNISFDFASPQGPTLVPTDPGSQFTLLSLPFPSSALSTPTPLFDAYLKHAFPDDTEAFTAYIYELIGYLLLPPVLSREPAAFYLYGETGAGKSVFLDVIEALFPPYLKSAISLYDLTTNRFSLAMLAGKLINIVDEDESEYVNGGKLKALTSQRPLQAERKFEQGFTFTPHAKFIFASNHLPTLKNIDPAVERRLHLVPFEHRVPEHQKDPNLSIKLTTQELPGIVGRALVAASRFATQGIKFHMPKKATDVREDFMLESSSAMSFFDSCYKVDPSLQTTNDQVYEDYLAYCRKFQKQPMSSMKFHIALKQVPGLVTTKGAQGKRLKNCVKRLDAPTLNV